jgi:drug/metabolite transporter (DMT)-like permease
VIKTKRMAFWALVAVNIIWGLGFVVIDDAINIMPTNIFNAFRFSLATLVLLPLWFITGKKSATENYQRTRMFKSGFGLGLLLFLGFALQTEGLNFTSVSNTGFITGLCVPLVPIIGFLLYRKKVGFEVWGSVVLATTGLYFLTIGDNLTINKGDVLVAFGALCYAIHITFMAKYSHEFPVVRFSIVQLGAVAVYCIIAAFVENGMGRYEQYASIWQQVSEPRVIAAIVYSGVLASAFAYWVQTSRQRLIEPHKIALVFALEPIFAHISAYFILSEHLGAQGWLGAGLIISAMLYAELGGNRKVKLQPLQHMAAPINKPD